MFASTWPNATAIRVPLKAFLSSDHISPATGKTIAITISKNGGAFGNPSAGATNATEISNGWYYVDLSTTDTGTNGPLIVRGTEGTIDPTETAFEVVAAGSGAPTTAQIATAVWTDLLASADFSTALSIGAKLKALAVGLSKNVAFADFQFRMVDDGGDPITGLTDADFNKKLYSIAGGANGTLSGTITEDPGGEGFYLIDLAQAELNGNSISLVFDANASGTIVTAMTIWPTTLS